MSKVSMPRPRYVAVALAGPPPSRRALADAVAKAARFPSGAAPQLTRYGFPHAIFRVDHGEQAALRKLLDGLEVAGCRLETLGAGGTLKALTGRLGILDQRT
ncbi:MAG: hypothetical protein ACYDBQ_00485 [Thermoplasmatota archaeon]